MRRVVCNYCSNPAELMSAQEIYGPNAEGMVWLCRPCDAYVGTHKGSPTHAPVGTLADRETRILRVAAHHALDLIISRFRRKRPDRSRTSVRRAAYSWLSKTLHIPVKRCHIGLFDADTCRAVVAVCESYDAMAGE